GAWGATGVEKRYRWCVPCGAGAGVAGVGGGDAAVLAGLLSVVQWRDRGSHRRLEGANRATGALAWSAGEVDIGGPGSGASGREPGVASVGRAGWLARGVLARACAIDGAGEEGVWRECSAVSSGGAR